MPRMKKLQIEYTPEQEAALAELRAAYDALPTLASRAGVKRLKISVETAKGGMFEQEYRREWDKDASPYGEPKPALVVQPLARPIR